MSDRSEHGKWIAHPADRLNAGRALTAPLLLFAPFVVDVFTGHEVVYGIVLLILIGDANYLLHLHIHRPFSGKPALNLLFDLSMGAVTGMVSSAWRIHHIYGHHRRIDLPYRGGSNISGDYSAIQAIAYPAATMWPTFCAPIVEAFAKGILKNIGTPISYRWALFEQLLLLLTVAVLACWQPRLVLAYLLPWYMVTYFITRYVDYLNHYGCDESSENPYARANNSISRWYNFTTHNFGYHTAHHMRPGAHWTELPAIHRAIADKIPNRHVKPFSWSWLLLPYHFYRSASGRM